MKHITITGRLGSGKSVISSRLQERLKMDIESVGTLQRKMAQDYKMSTIEFNTYMESHPKFDHELDEFVRKQGLNPIPKIFDSRVAWHFIPQSFKVYLYVLDDIAAGRIYNDNKRLNEKYANVEEALCYILQRRKSEVYRFKTQYGLNLEDLSNYDLVIDTSFVTLEEMNDIADFIIKSYKEGFSMRNKVWLSPFTLIPTQKIREHSIDKLSIISSSLKKIDDYVENPIKVIIYNDKFYIYDGHKRTLNAIVNNLTLLPCIFLNTQDEEFLSNGQSIGDYITDNFSQESLYDWNDFIKFLNK